ncbi:glycosyl transferase [Rhizocola hellebori]|uniref:Glycosyl transferase n=1 Tax=Rhizocola hellebori TaxID=1392758 RepID=A0A8J3VJH2_9ACTN|nr:glycosyltransferase family 4 protein [Rhizocola hellebori]GIH07993.1 glycosyl transferase [Rhizocola hellebori]
MTGTVHLVLPNDIDDPASPSGGNVYDRRVSQGLAALGWAVREHPVRGGWPHPSQAETAALSAVLASLPAGQTVLLDGLVACAAPEVMWSQAARLRLVILVHMPLAEAASSLRAGEGRALAAAAAIVTTSLWSRGRLLELYDLPPGRIHVAAPGVEAARLATASRAGNRLLCVAALARHKGHDLLGKALAEVADLPWSCVWVGPLQREQGFADELRQLIRVSGIADRVHLVGPCRGSALEFRYAQADLLVSASRVETYGMAVTEALARGIPVLAPAVGGLPEALGRAPQGALPGMLVRPGDHLELAAALRRWLTGEKLRDDLRRSARERRATLSGWALTARLLAGVLSASAVTMSKIYSPSVEDFADTP